MLLQDKSSLPLIFRHRAISRHFLWRQKEKKGPVEIAGSRDRIDLTIEEAGKKVNQSVKRDGEDGRSWRGEVNAMMKLVVAFYVDRTADVIIFFNTFLYSFRLDFV